MHFFIFALIFTIFLIHSIKKCCIFTLLLIEIKTKPHIKTPICPTCYNINSSIYRVSDYHDNSLN